MHTPLSNQNTQLLIVDDDEVFCQVLAQSLQRHNIATRVAHDRQSAIAALTQNGQDISHAVVDLNIGEDSGLNLIPELLAANSTMNIVILTGYSSIATTVEAIKRGAHNYLCKPASVDSILAAFDSKFRESEAQPTPPSQKPSVERLEWEYIQQTLSENNGNVSATARALGMHRRTLQRKLQKKPVAN